MCSNMRNRKRKISRVLIACLALLSLASGTPTTAAEPCLVFVSIAPQAHFVKAIGEAHVDVSVMVKPEKSPASYEPSPKQMVRLAKADIYFAIGVPFESAWLERFASTNPDMPIIHTEAGIEKKTVNRHGGKDKAAQVHGPGHTQGHGTEGIKDPHIWLSPPLVMLQARSIAAGLREVDPEHTGDYEKNYQTFINQVAALDIRLMKKLTPVANTRFMVFHPSWGYFADAYRLEQIPIEIEGKAPKARDVKELIQTARAQNIRTIFVQPQFSTKQAQIIAREIGGRTVTADPLAMDWAKNLEALADVIQHEAR